MPGGGSAHKRFRSGRGWYYGSAPYRLLSLRGPVPPGLSFVPPDPWPGDAHVGQELLNNVFHFAGQSFSAESPPWLAAEAGPAWLAELHGFDWLRHLRATGGDAARRQARVLVSAWLDQFGRGWHPVAWAPDVLGTRVAAWIGQHDFFLASADDELRARVFESLARQVRHLSRVTPGKLLGTTLTVALKGLAYGGLTLPGLSRAAEKARTALVRELPRQVLPDGGHAEHSPAQQLIVLRHLIDIRGCFRAARVEVPEALQHAIDRMTPTLRFFRHGDGGLALFNGAQEGEPVVIDTVLGQADARGRPLKSIPHVGFERLTAGRACVLLDAGPPPPPGLDEHAHAGTLSFEMSVGRERLIVNCGAHPAGVGPWRTALAATAAHSTVTVEDTNSSAVLPEGGLGRRPAKVESHRQDANNGGGLVDASHDGYRETHSLTHRRRLYLADTGEDLRGEDTLEGAGGKAFALRFHLHPGVQAVLDEEDARIAWLRLPSGNVWRLRATEALEIADSIYLGHGTDPAHTVQVVCRGVTAPGATTVKWALRREGNDGE
ncbi:hypothetical protein HHL28_08925 [Aerophototrophica crusticola]|uniref:Heparin-sulfate lyase N-terminal domain-containing protein n=1 Tax=Aerophototrophica crusticola TaxID=1709002 RepID=A0A858R7M3_9PROT|nr:hypothetical protein HHL28_08925 [Rhodospirillaceae bacterium B3]